MSQLKDWMNLSVSHRDREPARASLIPYADEAEAIAGDRDRPIGNNPPFGIHGNDRGAGYHRIHFHPSMPWRKMATQRDFRAHAVLLRLQTQHTV